ncbi:MAG TPA: hypothetical protein VHV28_02375 [Solirubrobacteraceae bacterium]|nr:hypothetical protein [Solirubrobacteraceae bacterium]
MLVVVVLVVLVFDVVVCVLVVTGGVRCVVVDLVVVVVTGATGAVLVTAGAAVVTGAVAVAVAVVVLCRTAGLWRRCFLWCTTRLGAAAASDDVAVDVVDEVAAADDVLEVLAPPELPQPATMTLTARTAPSRATFIDAPLVARALVLKANNG